MKQIVPRAFITWIFIAFAARADPPAPLLVLPPESKPARTDWFAVKGTTNLPDGCVSPLHKESGDSFQTGCGVDPPPNRFAAAWVQGADRHFTKLAFTAGADLAGASECEMVVQYAEPGGVVSESPVLVINADGDTTAAGDQVAIDVDFTIVEGAWYQYLFRGEQALGGAGTCTALYGEVFAVWSDV